MSLLRNLRNLVFTLVNDYSWRMVVAALAFAGTDPIRADCQAECRETLQCGHQCQNRCGQPCTQLCQVVVTLDNPHCGHKYQAKCSERDSVVCSQPCGSVQPSVSWLTASFILFGWLYTAVIVFGWLQSVTATSDASPPPPPPPHTHTHSMPGSVGCLSSSNIRALICTEFLMLQLF